MTEVNGDINGLSTDESQFHRITKSKNPGKSVPWEDDSVIMVNAKTTSYNMSQSYAGASPNHNNSNNAIKSQSCSSPLKTCLNPPELPSANRSPSPSPKFRKKNLQANNSLPIKPGAVDNSPLLMPSTTKVRIFSSSILLLLEVIDNPQFKC